MNRDYKDTHDHEADMARADLLKLAEYSMQLFKMIKPGDNLEGWTASKITKAADYVSSVYHYMEYEEVKAQEKSHMMRVMSSKDEYMENLAKDLKNYLKEK